MGMQTFPQILVSSIADGPTLTTAAAASCIPPSCVITLPNNYWYVGRIWRLTMSGRISCAVTTPGTARFDIRLGAVVAFDSLAMNLNIVAKTNVHWRLETLLTCRAVGGSGASSNIIGQGRFMSEATVGAPLPTVGGIGALAVPVNAAPAVGTNFDNNLANTVNVFFTQTVATGSMTVHQYLLEELN